MGIRKVLVLGAGGLLGADLVPYLMSKGYTVATHGRGSGDYKFALNSTELVNQTLDKISPDYVVNLVGLTDVDQCEREPNQAYADNVRSVENVTNWLSKKNGLVHLIHISTDQVYDGSGIHTESNVTLTNYYAFSKYAGELVASKVGATVLRTNFFGRSHCGKRTSLTDWLFGALSKKESIRVFEDVQFSPLSMSTLVELIEVCIRKKPSGIFNVGTKNGFSKADFAFSFARHLNLRNDKMERTTTDQVTFLKTYRPKDMRMDCSLFEKSMGVSMPNLEDEIIKVAKEYV